MKTIWKRITWKTKMWKGRRKTEVVLLLQHKVMKDYNSF